MSEISAFRRSEDVIFDKFNEVFDASHDCIFVALCFDDLLKAFLCILLSAGLCLELDKQAVILCVGINKLHVCDTGCYTFSFHYLRFCSATIATVADCEDVILQVRELKPEPREARLLYLAFFVSHS